MIGKRWSPFWAGFWFGFAVGALTALTTGNARRPTDPDTIARRYRLWAPFYHPFGVRLQERLVPVRDRLADMAHLRPGGRVLDLACGTGGNLPFILARVGPEGSVVGVDYSRDMLRRAGTLVDAHGWANVRLTRADASVLDLGERFDAVLCSFGLTAIPDYVGAMERALAHLEPGGAFAAADGRLSHRAGAALLSRLVDLMALSAGGDLSRRPWVWLAAHTADFQYREALFGVLYLMAGRRPIYA